MIKETVITTERFILKDLTVNDVTRRYLQWFGDSSTKKYIDAASTTKSLDDLRNYIMERTGRDDILFLGIFTRNEGLHIGNIKYEPVNLEEKYAIMGIMIGDAEYRGKGVAAEILKASGRWLRENLHIEQIVLGVNTDNTGAIKSYQKVGFITEPTRYIPHPPDYAITMVWHLDNE